jgi:hypothetical protein
VAHVEQVVRAEGDHHALRRRGHGGLRAGGGGSRELLGGAVRSCASGRGGAPRELHRPAGGARGGRTAHGARGASARAQARGARVAARARGAAATRLGAASDWGRGERARRRRAAANGSAAVFDHRAPQAVQKRDLCQRGKSLRGHLVGPRGAASLEYARAGAPREQGRASFLRQVSAFVTRGPHSVAVSLRLDAGPCGPARVPVAPSHCCSSQSPQAPIPALPRRPARRVVASQAVPAERLARVRAPPPPCPGSAPETRAYVRPDNGAYGGLQHVAPSMAAGSRSRQRGTTPARAPARRLGPGPRSRAGIGGERARALPRLQLPRIRPWVADEFRIRVQAMA